MEKNSMSHISDSAEVDQKKPIADRISELPNDIVEMILSKLKLRDAISTGFLSRRWKHMWEYRTGSLDIDLEYTPEVEYDDEGKVIKLDRSDKERYINAANKILNAHKGSTIEEFTLKYDLDVRNKLDIDSWIDFALRKKVRNLELKFTRPDRDSGIYDFGGSYEFPLLLLKKSNNLSSLINLRLHCVRFSGEVLNHILWNCPFLESLSVENVSSLSSKVLHLFPCPKLKHLDIGVYARVLVEISSAPNLESFIFTSSKLTRLSISNVPNLTHVSLGGSFCRAIVQGSRQLPSFLFELKNLTLELRAIMMFPHLNKFPELNNVNELKLTCKDSDNADAKKRDILSCASVMEACPNLNKLSVRFNEVLMEDEKVEKRVEWSVNKWLKVVEMEVFRGNKVELEFYKCLVSSAPSLDKIIVDISEIWDDDKKDNVDKSVRQITQKLSPCAELVMKS